MKKNACRTLCLLFSLLLLLSVAPMGAAAADIREEPLVIEGDGQGHFEVMLESRETDRSESAVLSSVSRSPSLGQTVNGWDFYSQLSTRQRTAYDAICSHPIGEIVNRATWDSSAQQRSTSYRASLNGFTGTTMTGTISSNGTFTPDSASSKTYRQLETDLLAAIVSVRYDHPDMLWLGTVGYGFSLESAGGNRVKITTVNLAFYLEYDGQENAYYQVTGQAAQKMADGTAPFADNYLKLLYIHEQLCAKNAYGDTAPRINHTAYSALILGTPVCEGYAKAFKLVCDRINIPCTIPSSADHMWNNVRMEDGKWYNVDVTFDDSRGDYKYFLVGDKPFSTEKDHIELPPYEEAMQQKKDALYVALLYPKKSETDYKYGSAGQTGKLFPDVSPFSWYYNAVTEASSLGLFSGDEKGYFLPEKPISRAEFCQVLASAYHADLTPYKGTSSYGDVSANAWYAAPVAWATQKGLVSGYGKGKFGPNDSITREQMCVIFAQATGGAVASSHVFADDGQVSGWARAAVYTCYERGLVSGKGENRFDPRGSFTRAEAAVVFPKALPSLQ